MRKHAPGARVTVGSSYDEAQVRADGPQHRADRPAPAAAWPAPAPGLGMASLRQRIELVHGTLRAGPRAGRRVLRRGHAARVRADRRIGGVTGVVRVVVVDDEPMVCAHLRTILGSAGDIEVVDEAHDGAAGRRGGRPQPARRGADGPAHAGHGRAHRDRADRRARPPAGGGGADDLRRRPVRAARAAGGRGRVPGQVDAAGGPDRPGAGGRRGAHRAVAGRRPPAGRGLDRRPSARDRARSSSAR